MKKNRKLTKREIEARLRKETREILKSLPFPNSMRIANRTLDAMFGKPRRKKAKKSEDMLELVLPHFVGDYFYRSVKGRSIRLTESELESRLEKSRAAIPSFAGALRKKLEEVQRELPRSGGPGREDALTQAEKIEAIELVATQIKLDKPAENQMKKVKTLNEIFEHVASQFKNRFEGTHRKVSGRTIKRYWENRAQILGQSA